MTYIYFHFISNKVSPGFMQQNTYVCWNIDRECLQISGISNLDVPFNPLLDSNIPNCLLKAHRVDALMNTYPVLIIASFGSVSLKHVLYFRSISCRTLQIIHMYLLRTMITDPTTMYEFEHSPNLNFLWRMIFIRCIFL